MQNFASLQQQLTPRPGTVNYSNTAPVLRMLALNAFRGVLATIGASVAGPLGVAAGFAANPAARALGERTAAGRVARSLYQTPAQQHAESALAERLGRFGALGSRIVAPPLTPRGQQP